MSFVKYRLALRIIVSAISFLCAVVVSAMIHVRASNDLDGKPSVDLRASRNSITYACPPGTLSLSRSCPTEFEARVSLRAFATGFNKQAAYSYSVNGGQILGEGSEVTWDLSRAEPGSYTVTVEVSDSRKHRATTFTNMNVALCRDCVPDCFPCPMFFVSCYDSVNAGTPITCKVVLTPGARFNPTGYEWSARASNDEDLSPRIRRSGEYISLPTNDLAARMVYIRVDVKGLDPSCNQSASAEIVIRH
jgi:hypothetical protein